MKDNATEFQELELRESNVICSLQAAYDKGDYPAAHLLEEELETVRGKIYEYWQGQLKKIKE